jgi:UDP-N-acetylmuramate: L-alanyl-gamma-D-glutamyl-meso-diaminopimelate ligase
VGEEKIIALIEPRSNTMRAGVHKDSLLTACRDADEVYWFQPPELQWDLQNIIDQSSVPAKLFSNVDELVNQALKPIEAPMHIVIMSNGGFGGIQQKLVSALDVK